jgi:hypothetical protein
MRPKIVFYLQILSERCRIKSCESYNKNWASQIFETKIIIWADEVIIIIIIITIIIIINGWQ